jgi:hypothetical protein
MRLTASLYAGGWRGNRGGVPFGDAPALGCRRCVGWEGVDEVGVIWIEADDDPGGRLPGVDAW